MIAGAIMVAKHRAVRIMTVVLWWRVRLPLAPAVDDLADTLPDTPDNCPACPGTVPLEAPEPATERLRPTARWRGPASFDGDRLAWHFRATILDRLEEYFVCLRRLKRKDPEAYRTFARLGFAVPPDHWANPDYQDNHVKALARRVTLGGCSVPRDAEDKRGYIIPSFIYFRKLRTGSAAFSGVQAWGGDIYQLNALYDDRDSSRHWLSNMAYLGTCHLGIAADGAIELLRQQRVVRQVITPKRKRKGARQPAYIEVSTRQWEYPDWAVDAAAERQMDPGQWTRNMLVLALVTYTASLDQIIIRARRNGCTAAFGIELPRAKYFFRDRDKHTALAADGRRKRIFHSVVAHKRELATGRVTDVKSHYRGLRSFDWQGHAIRIVFPDHTPLVRFDAPEQPAEECPGGLLEHDVADQLAAALEA